MSIVLRGNLVSRWGTTGLNVEPCCFAGWIVKFRRCYSRDTGHMRGSLVMSIKSQTPDVIRAACRARFYARLEDLDGIASDPDERSADRIKAIHELGAFGLGTADQAAVYIHAGAGSQVIGVVHLPQLEPRAEGETEEDGIDGGELPANEDEVEPKLLVLGE